MPANVGDHRNGDSVQCGQMIRIMILFLYREEDPLLKKTDHEWVLEGK
jgi:hypothetical protein